jgi:hypothetical protein
MFPILMDEPDAMTVAPRAWQMLQDAWRGPAQIKHTAGREPRARRPPADPQPTPLASLAFGTASADPHPRR